jgi:NADAR domain
MEQLLLAESTGTRVKFLPFWGHTPPADRTIGPHVFSQWFAHAFEHDGTRYGTAEHFMMAGKARLFGDDDALDRILAARIPAQARAIGASDGLPNGRILVLRMLNATDEFGYRKATVVNRLGRWDSSTRCGVSDHAPVFRWPERAIC